MATTKKIVVPCFLYISSPLDWGKMAKKQEPDTINLQVCNWKKYQKKGSRIFHRMDNNHYMSPKIRQLTSGQYRLWAYLLCVASEQDNDGFVSTLSATVRFGSLTRGSSLQVSLSKLSELGLIVLYKERKNRKREENSLNSENFTPKKPKKKNNYAEDFETLWNLWPKGDGGGGSKAAAQKNIKKFLENQSKEMLRNCATNYLEWFEQKEPKPYPYRLSNFFGEKAYWEEFQDSHVQKQDPNKEVKAKITPLPGSPGFEEWFKKQEGKDV